MRDWIALLAGIVISLLMFAANPFNVDHHANLVLAVATLMVVWWVTEAIPMPVVALLPLILFPLFGIETLKNTSVSLFVQPARAVTGSCSDLFCQPASSACG